MFEVMSESAGNIIGVRMQGTLHKADYAELAPKVEALAEQFDDIRMLCDLGEFKMEAPDAFAADLKFGKEFHKKIAKMAIVGDKRWEEWLTKLATPFYAKEARYFHTNEMDAAWAWVKA